MIKRITIDIIINKQLHALILANIIKVILVYKYPYCIQTINEISLPYHTS